MRGKRASTILDIPVLAIELQHAGILPDEDHQRRIWQDLQQWLLLDAKAGK